MILRSKSKWFMCIWVILSFYASNYPIKAELGDRKPLEDRKELGDMKPLEDMKPLGDKTHDMSL